MRAAPSRARILIIGIAYKKNVDDMRESPSLKLIELIEARGAHVDYHDPLHPGDSADARACVLAGRRSVGVDAATLSRYDAVLIATDHDEIDYAALVDGAKVVVDTRNACVRAGVAADRVVKA